MRTKNSLIRSGRFAGAKIRSLRKKNNLTMEDLSLRCMQIDPKGAPSVSYLSMIETGKRVPSEQVLEAIAAVFQKDVSWFMDGAAEKEALIESNQKGGLDGVALEPSFLFSKKHLQSALPEMLSQTGTSGKQFGQLLVRAHQEHHRNHFPDLERAAEDVGKRKMPMSVADMQRLVAAHGLKVKWFRRPPDEIVDETNVSSKTVVRSFFEPPNTIYANEVLRTRDSSLKFDLATHVGHKVLYGGEGLSSTHLSGHGFIDKTYKEVNELHRSMTIDSTQILQAWRDFECSFFAGALLAPKQPFKQHLDRTACAIDLNDAIGVSPSAYMRRMTCTSPYPHWHYFDTYEPERLKAVYRGNGIPLPVGNMRPIKDPCPHWSLFQAFKEKRRTPRAQISVLRSGDAEVLYSCDSIHVIDLAGNPHVLCVGVSLNPALAAQGVDPQDIAGELKRRCIANGGTSDISEDVRTEIKRVARVLNISWIERGLESPAIAICSRAGLCPREQKCRGPRPADSDTLTIRDIRKQIIGIE